MRDGSPPGSASAFLLAGPRTCDLLVIPLDSSMDKLFLLVMSAAVIPLSLPQKENLGYQTFILRLLNFIFFCFGRVSRLRCSTDIQVLFFRVQCLTRGRV